MKQVMHDCEQHYRYLSWLDLLPAGPDEQAIDILAKLRPAMTPGYTKLLIHDIVVPPTKAPPYTTGIDLTMMALFGARERTQVDWEALVRTANLKLEKVWSGLEYRESLLEVVRVD